MDVDDGIGAAVVQWGQYGKGYYAAFGRVGRIRYRLTVYHRGATRWEWGAHGYDGRDRVVEEVGNAEGTDVGVAMTAAQDALASSLWRLVARRVG